MSTTRKKLEVSKATTEQKEQILKYAAEVREFEIGKFWQRSLFFWGFIGAAFVAYAQLFGKSNLSFYVACFGIVCSVAWTLQNRGSKYWQEAWESKVESVEVDVLGVSLFANREPKQCKGIWGAQTFSVSKLAIALSDFTVLVWIALAIKSFPSIPLPYVLNDVVIAAVVTIVYVALLFTCRQSERNSNSK
jgi:hypothetical protein